MAASNERPSNDRKSTGSMLQGRGGAGMYPCRLDRIAIAIAMLTRAGNIAPRSAALLPADLKTPTIKSDLYTTGRGGTGNMALNLHTQPELARAAQDVDAPQMLGREPENSVHYGRGGAANVAHMTSEAKASARARNEGRRKSEATGVVGQFGKEQREKQATEDADRERAKSKNAVEKGFEKLTRVLSSNGQTKK